MEQLFNKVREYLKMTEELPFVAFSGYFNDVTGYLQQNYQDMNDDDLIKAYGICGIVASNAEARAGHKDANRKKFTKMAEKTRFWEDAIKTRFVKGGMLPNELEEKCAAFFKEEPAAKG